MASQVLLEVNNKNFAGWNRVTVRRSMQEFLGSFSLELVDPTTGSPFGTVRKGDRCRLYVKSDDETKDQTEIEILNGYIDQVDKSRAGDSTSMSVSGRDITVDLVECSAIIPSNTWTKATLPKVARDLAKPFDLYVSDITEDQTPFKKITIQNGESGFSIIERLARQVGVLPLTNRFGDVVLTHSSTAEDTPPSAYLVDGVNILSITESSTGQDRFSEYIFKGQNSGDGSAWDEKTTSLKATATDSTVTRYRPLIVLSEGKTNQTDLQKRANWEAQVRAGRSLVHTVQVVDWFITEAELTSELRPWEVNIIVNLKSDPLGIDSLRLVTAVDFNLDPAGGRITTLELMDPLTYARDPDGKVEF